MRRRRNRPWRPRREVAAWRLEAWKFLLMNLRPAASVPGQMEQAIRLMGGGNRDHPYGSRDAQGKSVLFNTGGEDVPGWEFPDSDGAGDGAFRGGAGDDAGAGGGAAVEALQERRGVTSSPGWASGRQAWERRCPATSGRTA